MIRVNLVVKIELWANCVFVVIAGQGGKFVSYKDIPYHVISPLINAHRAPRFRRLEIVLATKESTRRYNDFLNIRAMCAFQGWNLVCDEFGYYIEGIFTTVWSHNLDTRIDAELHKGLEF
ncbi:MAG: hypothetical protein AB4372_01590 [Xenococcus sp. (in: cyanobacteria)]